MKPPLRTELGRLPATATRDIIPATCPPDALALDPAVSCGYVPVPLDRKHPNREKINIYFEVYPHTDPGPAESAILFNIGGGGTSTTNLRSGWLAIFSGNLDKHDLLLIDDRGRGLSGTIVCPELQQIGSGPLLINATDTALWDPAVADCAAQLGNAASRTGELLAAAASLNRGDPAPLLRLGAEVSFQVAGAEDPTSFSHGAEMAVVSMDTDQPWEWSDPVSERERQYMEAVEELPPGYFAPFSKPAATSLLFSLYSRRCLWWQKPTPSSPVAPPNATYPSVPTLVLTGDIDAVVPLEETTKVAALFPNSTFITVEGAGHPAIGWSQCAGNLESQFLETLQPGDTSCANTPEVVWPAVGRFPLLVQQARPADVNPNGQNQIGVAERKVVTVAVAAAIDALQRSIIGSGDGVGLRAGTFHTDYLPTGEWHTALTNCAFANDVTVNGTLTWGSDNSLVADLTVSGAGTSGGTLHVEGGWDVPGPVGNFTVTGTLGGKHVAVLVPEA